MQDKAQNKAAARTAPAVRELTDEELDRASGGKVTVQFSFPGITFRFGTDANGDFFGSAVTDTKGVHHVL